MSEHCEHRNVTWARYGGRSTARMLCRECGWEARPRKMIDTLMYYAIGGTLQSPAEEVLGWKQHGKTNGKNKDPSREDNISKST